MSELGDAPIFYFTRMLTAYRIPILERLNERLDGRLVVCFGQPPRATSTLIGPQEGAFRQHRLRNYWFRGETLHAQPFESVFEKYGAPSVVLAEESPRSITLPLLLRRARKEGAGRVLWGMFSSFTRPLSQKNVSQRYRFALAHRVDACACYTVGTRDYLATRVPAEKLFVAQNTLDTDVLFRERRQLEVEGKTAVRGRLRIPVTQPVIVFIGQLIKRKGTEQLLNVFAKLSRERSATLLVIGDGPERQSMEQRVAEEAIQDVRFLGSMASLEQSAPYIFAADAMLLPGYVGLAVNHGLAMGCPVVTQRSPDNTPFHAPEVESVIDNHTGMLAEPSTVGLLTALSTVLNDTARFSSNAASYAEKFLTIDRMVDGLYQAIIYARERSNQRL